MTALFWILAGLALANGGPLASIVLIAAYAAFCWYRNEQKKWGMW